MGDDSPDAWVQRNPAQWRHGKTNAECPVDLLGNSYATPADLMFIRSHGPVPRLDSSHTIQINGLVEKPATFTVGDLKTRFPTRKVWSALVCSGSRRKELNIIKHGGGHIDWHSAVGNGEWEGVYLRDVLLSLGVSQDFAVAKHVEFEGADTHSSGYRTSVPFATAFDPAGEVLLAWGLNGEALPPDHGFPLRVLIPGVTGARSCKWLTRITVQSEDTDHHMHKNYYKVLPPHIMSPKGHMEEILAVPPLYDININSVVFDPPTGTPAVAGPLKVRGYAYCGGGRPVERVEVSLDGTTWVQSTFTEQRRTAAGKMFAWVWWETTVDFDPAQHRELVVRAWDSHINTQPERPIWNYNGMMNNCQFRLKVGPSDKGALEWQHPTTWMEKPATAKL
uniref:Sulfite oxidase n=1 Tax=Noctiluca scintillans TaxID=2966 RepID=A0A7S1FGN9_NOCSC|mmetsp:Transcript_62190/g.165144  ORF Transcript_62190/g.165144 Transcript_62190/m.165144 type:complete len:393 (+) Transcript_62190:60-1238(+)